ncbi:O-acetylhomoserine aminocarboxypropyltransferase/cysteine synthase [Alloscardovia theropitheci]|uniref:homocysteine desulfhydrase n=1 Tax=Alloscardovia theropitheci TaxID=2496842 RepID=A0A4R0QQV4_9BIFI|nr:PLP-dependent transferase [Alloscardovia theropitheci]TCD54713.1 O-acetylhomoserine aminocarboxypropyltransferase/cysteine synthase [Alloscardovia theropitheci]
MSQENCQCDCRNQERTAQVKEKSSITVKHSFETERLHAGYNPSEHHDSIQVPIYQTAAFTMPSAEAGRDIAEGRLPGFTYSRVGNPTVDILEKRLTALDSGVGAACVGSGMAAISNALLCAAEGGGRIVTHHDIYGATLDIFVNFLAKFGIEVDFVDDINNPDELRNAIKSDTKAIYVESVTNPRTVITDLDLVSSIAHAAGIPLIVDNTFPTPYLIQPIKYGADIVVYSSTKAINGHANAVSGVIIDGGTFDWQTHSDRFPQFDEPEFTLYNDQLDHVPSYNEVYGNQAFIQRVKGKYVRLLGAVLGPQEAYLEIIGLETIAERLNKQVASTRKIVEYLNSNPHVARVNYSDQPSSFQADLVEKYYPHGIGSIFSFELEGSEDRVNRVINACRIFSYVPNVGDVRSLIVNPARTTHREIPYEFWEKDGLNPQLIRLSIGLENVDDLIADLDNAITTAFND